MCFYCCYKPPKNCQRKFFFNQSTPCPPPLHENILTATARSQSLELISPISLHSKKSQLFQKQFDFDPSQKNLNLSPHPPDTNSQSPSPHSKYLNSLEYVNRYSIPPIIFFPLSFYVLTFNFQKEYLNYFIFFVGGVESPDPSPPPPPLYTPLYIVHKIKYHATAVCKLRCIEVIFVIK